jgi:small subunit ribosomal protein S16
VSLAPPRRTPTRRSGEHPHSVRGEHHPPWQPRSSSCAWARCARRTTASSSPTPAPSATGRSIETIGKYHPKEDPSFIEVDSDAAQYWLGVGAQPTEAVAAILRVTGDWQKFKGEPAPPPMKVAEPKPDKKALYEAAVRAGMDEPTTEATTAKKKAAPKKTAAADEAPAEAVAEAAGSAGEGPAAGAPSETPAE